MMSLCLIDTKEKQIFEKYLWSSTLLNWASKQDLFPFPFIKTIKKYMNISLMELDLMNLDTQ